MHMAWAMSSAFQTEAQMSNPTLHPNPVSEICGINPAVLQAFQQLVIQRIFSSRRGHATLFFKQKQCSRGIGTHCGGNFNLGGWQAPVK
jgi:hypothetical protein